jgi:hypothetical protein
MVLVKQDREILKVVREVSRTKKSEGKVSLRPEPLRFKKQLYLTWVSFGRERPF